MSDHEATTAPGAGDFVQDLTDQTDDFSRWYGEVVQKAQLADYAPVRGCMVIRPYGFAIWELMQAALDRRIKETGHQNAYFPLFIPEAFLAKEAEHVQGFAPQVAWVTQGGDERLQERLVVRPTSEAIICHMYSRWIDSHRDLPVLINQWANVVRWEKVTRMFLRTTEFLWQEGHTAHATAEEAEDETLRMLEVYRDFIETELAIPVIKGRKTDQEKFAGAVRTYAVEALMGDGKGLQAGTSHNLGQHFAKVFDITFQDADGARKHVWQTSWGVTTRLMGALVMVHGDDSGLKIPPRVAPVQAVVIPIYRKETERAAVLEAARQAASNLRSAGVRVYLDDRDQYTPGWKYNEHELRGVPLRLELGPRDVASRQVVAVRRDVRAKEAVAWDYLAVRVPQLLQEIQQDLFQRALDFRERSTRVAETLEQMELILGEHRGFVRAHWCGKTSCEDEAKARCSATIRCIPLDDHSGPGKCVVCGEPAETRVVFAKAY
ncbi:MAG TPA: proline--tRNA ligase [Candidatus Saccharimonadales bacterium]|nr:proline--tRNA ligase [Candidatus Saccharimonadales bacterium]